MAEMRPPQVTMASVLRRLLPNPSWNPIHYEQTCSLRIRVRNEYEEQALSIMEMRMKQSGMERLIKRYEDHMVHHMKNSEKRVLTCEKLQIRIRSQELACKFQAIIASKIRGQ